MNQWLSVIGISEEGALALTPKALELIKNAEYIVGGERHFKLVDSVISGNTPRLIWKTPLISTIDDINSHKNNPVVVLATGDPMAFGVGRTLARYYSSDEMLILPAPSAFSLACARLAWAVEETLCISLHGRPIKTLRAHLGIRKKILALSNDGKTPSMVALELEELGYGESLMTVYENMGNSHEKVSQQTAMNWGGKSVADLNIIAIECRGTTNTKRFSDGGGIPDRAFYNNGQLTKREIRIITLAALKPMLGGLLWDIGAGSGSISIEWLLANPNNEAIAIEQRADGCESIMRNASNLGVPRLRIEQVRAPKSLDKIPSPDAIFIGGGVSIPDVLEISWSRLKIGGCLVANTVTTIGEETLIKFHRKYGGNLTRMMISRATPMGQHIGWRPLSPITQLEITKS